MSNKSRMILETALEELREEESWIHDCVVAMERVIADMSKRELPAGPPPTFETRPPFIVDQPVSDLPVTLKKRRGRRTNAEIAAAAERIKAAQPKKLPPPATAPALENVPPEAKCARATCSETFSQHNGGGQCSRCWCYGFVGSEQFASTK